MTRPRVHLRLTERNRIARILCMSRSRAALHGCTVVPRSSNGTASLAKICVERAVRYGTGSLPNHSCKAGCSPLAIASLRSSRGLKLHNGVRRATLHGAADGMQVFVYRHTQRGTKILHNPAAFHVCVCADHECRMLAMYFLWSVQAPRQRTAIEFLFFLNSAKTSKSCSCDVIMVEAAHLLQAQRGVVRIQLRESAPQAALPPRWHRGSPLGRGVRHGRAQVQARRCGQ